MKYNKMSIHIIYEEIRKPRKILRELNLKIKLIYESIKKQRRIIFLKSLKYIFVALYIIM